MAAITEEMARSVDEVRQGWIPTSIYSDPGVFQEESRRLFTRTWHFMAHESEMPNNGDYVVRNLLKDSFIVARGDDAKVRVLLNLCRHRGGQVCRNESGNTRRFMCPYHAWNYKNDGSLVGVPYHEEAYGGEAVLSRKDHGLLPPPRTETFNGLIFINLDPDALPLEEYLGDYAAYLAFYFPPAPRAVEVRGPQRWRFKANWKIGAENFSGDTYHTPHTHASTGAIQLVSSAATSNRKAGIIYAAGRGNGATFRLPPGTFAERLRAVGYPDDQIERLAQHLSPEMRSLIENDGVIPSATTLFPNFSLLHLSARIDDHGTQAPFTTARVWIPISATETEVLSFFVVDKDASPEFKERSYKAYIMCFGTSGMFEQDDMDAWVTLTRMTQGYMSGSVHLHARMGLRGDDTPLNEPLKDYTGPGVAHVGFNEFNQRRWLNFWADHLEMDVPASPVRAPDRLFKQAAE
jgi:phenylpropionate dioxygenase-like ring-hydroxylating dioxygenase large terminal subunit